MDRNETLNEIREVNLSFLVLAQRLARLDSAMAMRLLKVSDQSVDAIATLPPGLIVKLAATNILFCRFALDDCALLASLANGVRRGAGRPAPRALAA
ncbi:flagellar transcriptional regulator FlhD [Paraburkholderia sp. C35]|uniref:flagellar transcriptional regulator FlhD n=1 Tax=Paraburkholderia sp. C35 TaxID=2126993 RepID=UPI000D68B5BD|nr:flagellar transcriptional regulator FlhD [Paraburkholderia sp. C35]